MFSILLGAHVPLTMEGNLVVDEVLASCYSSANHDLAHIGMIPIRYFPSIMKLIFGEYNGSSVYTNIADHFGEWVFPANYFMKIQ